MVVVMVIMVATILGVVVAEPERLEVMLDSPVGQLHLMDIGQEPVVLEERLIFQFLVHLSIMPAEVVEELKILLSRINLLP
tara:strand:- start:236 stop:478 length:243 start_codon:yes stop_codon:yes gene_type:complete